MKEKFKELFDKAKVKLAENGRFTAILVCVIALVVLMSIF